MHKFIKDHYNLKFPELESLILQPIDYAKVVKLLGNEMVCSASLQLWTAANFFLDC